MINPLQEITDKIQGISSILHQPNNLEYVSYKNWDIRLKQIEKHNLRKYGKSLSWCSMQSYFNYCIKEIQADSKIMIVNKPQYKLIAGYLKSEQFNRRKSQ